MATKEEFKDSDQYFADLDESRPWFSFPGYIPMNDLDDQLNKSIRAGRRGYENPETLPSSRVLMDDDSVEMSELNKFEI